MFPVLFKIGPLTLYAYGLLVATGFLLGIAWTLREARYAGLNRDAVLDLGFFLVIAAVIGSRALFVIISWNFSGMMKW